MGRWNDGKGGLAHREGIRQKHRRGEVGAARSATLCRIPDYAESSMKDVHLALSWRTKMTKTIRHSREVFIGLSGRSTGHRQADSDLSFWS